MEKLSSLISKKVISLQEGKLCGYVLDIVLDEKLKTFEGCIVADDENESTFFLSRKGIFSQGEECIMIEGDEKLEFEISSLSNNPIGKIVYDTNGINLGRVTDVQVAGKNVKKIITNKCEFPQKLILKSGDNFIIFGLSKNSKKIKNNKPIFKNKEKINNFQEKMPKVVVANQINVSNSQIIGEKQMRIFANPNSLLGRTITNDLFGMNNEIIARKNEKINKNIIKNAKNHNKLNILSYFSK